MADTLTVRTFGITLVRVLAPHRDPIAVSGLGGTLRPRRIARQQWDEYADLALAEATEPASSAGPAVTHG